MKNNERTIKQLCNAYNKGSGGKHAKSPFILNFTEYINLSLSIV